MGKLLSEAVKSLGGKGRRQAGVRAGRRADGGRGAGGGGRASKRALITNAGRFQVAKVLSALYDTGRMLKPGETLGEIPETKAIYRNIYEIALPSVAEMVLMSLIGSVDTMMVGTLGTNALAAVGLVGQPRMLLLSIFFALNIGVTAIVARRKGEGRPDEANRTMRNAIVLAVGLSVLITVLGRVFSGALMELAQAQPETYADAKTYFEIVTYFLPVNALTLCICAAQRGVGNTRITMNVNIASNLVNVVFQLSADRRQFRLSRLEVAGAAIATGIGFMVGLVLAVATVYGHSKNSGFLRLSIRDDWRLDRETVKGIAKVGGNAMLEQLALRFGFFFYAIIVASLGTAIFAAHQICMQFLNISFTFGDGIGIAGTSLVGQSLGRCRPDMAKLYGKASQRLALTAAFLLAGVILIFRGTMVGWFTSDPEVWTLAWLVMLMVAVFQPLQTSSVVISGALRGAGDTGYVAGVMLLCVAVIRPVLALLAIYLIREIFGRPDIALLGAWGASIIDMTIRLTMVYRRFNGGKWHDIKV
jgi:putative MATE family efflux protein